MSATNVMNRLDRDYFEKSGGIFSPSDHHNQMLRF